MGNFTRKVFADGEYMRRSCRLVRARPKWADPEAMWEIKKESYQKTRETGERWVTDHIVPLSSPVVCGLDAQTNLQVITRIENSRKGNRHWPDMWEQE